MPALRFAAPYPAGTLYRLLGPLDVRCSLELKRRRRKEVFEVRDRSLASTVIIRPLVRPAMILNLLHSCLQTRYTGAVVVTRTKTRPVCRGLRKSDAPTVVSTQRSHGRFVILKKLLFSSPRVPSDGLAHAQQRASALGHLVVVGRSEA